MKLIIDIPEKDYEWAKEITESRNKSVYCERQIIAIANGIPLDDIKEELQEKSEDDILSTGEQIGLIIALEIIDKGGKDK